MGNVGRPKLEISRDKAMTIRLTNFEFEKIARVAEKKNLTKTEAILKGIDLLEKNKPKLTRSEFNKLKGIQPKIQQKNSLGAIEGETVMFNKK